MTLKNQIKSLVALSESSGWSTLNEVMKQEVLELALSMARTKEMSQQEMDFNRGAIWLAILNVKRKRLTPWAELGSAVIDEISGSTNI